MIGLIIYLRNDRLWSGQKWPIIYDVWGDRLALTPPRHALLKVRILQIQREVLQVGNYSGIVIPEQAFHRKEITMTQAEHLQLIIMELHKCKDLSLLQLIYQLLLSESGEELPDDSVLLGT